MLSKSKAIILHNVKYGDSSLIVNLYSENYGRLSCLANGVRSKKSKFPIAYFHPLNILEIDLYYRHNREIQRLKEATLYCNYKSIPFDISKSSIAFFLAEVLYLSLREEENNSVLFNFLYNSFQKFDSIDKNAVVFHLWFMIRLTEYLGITLPENFFGKDETRDIYSESFSVFNSLSKNALNYLELLFKSREFPLIIIPNSERNEILESLIKYYSLNIDGFSRLKSYQILHQVFN